MARMLDRLLKLQAPENQLPPPGLTLPPRIGTEKGRQHKVLLGDATLPQVVAYRKMLAQQKDRLIEILDKLIAFMRKHAGRRRVTVAQVMAEQGRFEFNEIKTSGSSA